MSEESQQSEKTGDPYFVPMCMNCEAVMEKVEDWGMGMQGGSCDCPKCGEQHSYRITSGVMTLSRVSVPIGCAGPVEKVFHHSQEGGS